MTTTHTPGPWFVDDAVDTTHLAACMIANPSWVAIEDTDPYGGHLAYCHPDNAPIIAEAPAMLAALRDAYQSRVFGPRLTSEVRAILARIDGEG
jgi:hypothetical protein